MSDTDTGHADEQQGQLPLPVPLEARGFVFERVLERNVAQGGISDAEVMVAAARLDRSPRTLRYWLSQGRMAQIDRPRVRIEGDLRDLYFDCCGIVAEVRRRLEQEYDRQVAAGERDPDDRPPSRRNLNTAVQRDIPPQVRRHVRKGAQQAKDQVLRLRRNPNPIDVELIVMEVDTKDLHIRIHETDVPVTVTSAVLPAWSYVAGLHVGLGECADAVSFCLFDAMRLVGVPDVVQLDNQPANTGSQVGRSLDGVVDRVMTAPFSGEQNGGVEAWNGKLERRAGPQLGEWVNGPRRLDGTLYFEGIRFPFVYVRERVRALAVQHNEHAEIERLGGMSPAEAMALADRRCRPILPHELLFMLPSLLVKVTDEGVRVGEGEPYWSEDLFDKVGTDVVVHWAPPRPESVFIKHDGRFLAEARLHADVTQDERDRAVGRQANLFATVEEELEAAVLRMGEAVDQAVARSERLPASAADASPSPSPLDARRRPSKPTRDRDFGVLDAA